MEKDTQLPSDEVCPPVNTSYASTELRNVPESLATAIPISNITQFSEFLQKGATGTRKVIIFRVCFEILALESHY